MYLRNKSKHSFLLPTLSLSVLLLISSHSHSYMHVLTALIFIEQLLYCVIMSNWIMTPGNKLSWNPQDLHRTPDKVSG